MENKTFFDLSFLAKIKCSINCPGILKTAYYFLGQCTVFPHFQQGLCSKNYPGQLKSTKQHYRCFKVVKRLIANFVHFFSEMNFFLHFYPFLNSQSSSFHKKKLFSVIEIKDLCRYGKLNRFCTVKETQHRGL